MQTAYSEKVGEWEAAGAAGGGRVAVGGAGRLAGTLLADELKKGKN
ncbi:MAG: hypothetical protein IT165_33300 [Bryobacterales bacterium]|nr:hypothetical protein [Bryobacterales bacterium]